MTTKEWSRVEGWIQIDAAFRAYSTWSDCLADYAEIIETRSWYADAAAFPDDWEKYLDGLLPDPSRKEPGWATDPGYRQKIAAIVLRFDLDK
jgi:flagellum-specific peptidoglycan hydrolase FlgJ